MFGPKVPDRFEPRKIEGDPIPDPPAFFARLRIQIADAGADAQLKPGERCLGVVTPGRMLMMIPAGAPGTMPANLLDQVTRLAAASSPLKAQGPLLATSNKTGTPPAASPSCASSLKVTAIGFTDIKALQEDRQKCLPLLVPLVALAHVGHSVVVFEGSAGAFEGALNAVDMLIVDSGMLPFLDKSWAARAWEFMNPGGRILVFQRKSGALLPVIRSKNAQGWRFGEQDGEVSYLNCLLTTLAKIPPVGVEVVAAHSVPDLAGLVTDPAQLEWISELPFRYDALSADKVIAFTLQLAKLSRAAGEANGVLQAKMVVGNQISQVTFQIRLMKDSEGLERLRILKASS